MKSVKRYLLLFLVALMACSCTTGEFLGTIAMIVVLSVIAAIASVNSQSSKKDGKLLGESESERAKIEKEYEDAYFRAYEAQKKRRDEAQKRLEAKREELVLRMGVPDKTIILKENDLNQEIRAYASKRIITILGKDYDFSSIIECHLTDNTTVEKGETTISSTGTQKTNGGSMLGRAVVGGVLAGGVGAAIGGATARRNTESTSVVHQGMDKTHHDYVVWITVKDIAKPLIQLPLGKDGVKANEIVSLMNAIIAS